MNWLSSASMLLKSDKIPRIYGNGPMILSLYRDNSLRYHNLPNYLDFFPKNVLMELKRDQFFQYCKLRESPIERLLETQKYLKDIRFLNLKGISLII